MLIMKKRSVMLQALISRSQREVGETTLNTNKNPFIKLHCRMAVGFSEKFAIYNSALHFTSMEILSCREAFELSL